MAFSSMHFLIRWCETRCLITIAFSLALEYATRKVQENKLVPELNGTHHFLAYVHDVNLLSENI
jgi:hypothetical protein